MRVVVRKKEDRGWWREGRKIEENSRADVSERQKRGRGGKAGRGELPPTVEKRANARAPFGT